MRRYKRLVYRFKDRIYAFAYLYLRNREDAEEVTQDVLLRLWDHYQALEEEGIPSWIMRVTRNLSIDYLRKRRTRSRNVAVDSEAPAFRLAASGDSSADERLGGQDFRQAVLRAMEELTEPQRSIVQLREIHGCSYTEIGAAMDLPLNSVKVYLHRGRRTLREMLSQQWQHEYKH